MVGDSLHTHGQLLNRFIDEADEETVDDLEFCLQSESIFRKDAEGNVHDRPGLLQVNTQETFPREDRAQKLRGILIRQNDAVGSEMFEYVARQLVDVDVVLIDDVECVE